MKGYELLAKLTKDFKVTGTAGKPIFCRDEMGRIFTIVNTEREEHEDAVDPITHWIIMEEL